jgi:elongator complex protein 1
MSFIVQGDSKLILMTATFDILSEAPLHTADFGDGAYCFPILCALFSPTIIPQDAPINVGWGSKQTQFHGSLGKAAAHQSSTTKVSTSSDDDTLPRISWRGDGSLFSVSSLSPPDSSGTRRRLIRVYDRTAALQSTSEPVPGLEHPLAWRPSGNLIAATQRFAFDGGGAGVEGRHDIVFFEKNGLQHGQFELRPKEFMANAKGKDVSTRQWGYRVRELSWSSDSNVLCIWIERDDGDLGA